MLFKQTLRKVTVLFNIIVAVAPRTRTDVDRFERSGNIPRGGRLQDEEAAREKMDSDTVMKSRARVVICHMPECIRYSV